MRENLLIDSLPETVTVDGREFPINYDFRTGILFELLIYDRTVSNEEKCNLIFDLYFDRCIDTVPKTEEAVDAILSFYRCGKEAKSEAKKSDEPEEAEQSKKQIYNYEHDDAYIYAAFYGQYGIDLNDVQNLHWWKFRALFSALNNDQKIVEIMGYRGAELSKIKDKKERQRIAKMKAIYALPSNDTPEEKAEKAAALFSGGI